MASTASSPTVISVPDSLLIFGGGGHGRVVADAAMSCRRWVHILASDRNPERARGELLPGVPFVDAGILAITAAAVHVAIGDNAAREREAKVMARSLATVCHPSAVISAQARVGYGCFFAASCVVAPGATVEDGAIINHGAVVDHDVRVGAYSHVAPNATLGGTVALGMRVLVGAGAVILPGISVADDVIIGAGSVVQSTIAASGVWAGVPARRIG